MAVPTLDASNLQTIDLAEATTQWGGDTFSLEPDDKVQGSNSVSCALTNNGANDVWVDIASGSWNIDGSHLRLWFKITFLGNLANQAGNGIQVFVSDGTNTDYFTTSGSDTYPGGWFNVVLVCDATRFPNVTRTAITQVGMRFNTTSKPRNVPANAWFDAWRFGDFIIATGGTNGDEINMDEIAAVDNSNAYGVVTNSNGVNFLRGEVRIGNGATTTFYKDDNKINVFVDEIVSSTLYQLLFQGSGCTVDILDTVIKGDGAATFVFDADDVDLASFTMSGSNVTNGGLIRFKGGQTITGTVFNSCDQITPQTASMAQCTVKNYSGTEGAMLLPSGNTHNVTDSDFEGNSNAIEIDTNFASGYDFNALIFTSNTFDVNNTSGASQDVNKQNGSNPSTFTGSTVTFVAAFTLTLTGIPSGVNVTIVNSSTRAELQHSTSTGVDITYSHGGGETVDILLMGLDYDPNDSDLFNLTLDNADQSIPFSVGDDRNYENPA